MGNSAAKGDAAEPLPGDGVGDLTAQQLVAEPVAVLEEHQPQVGVDRDRGPVARGIEVSPEGLDERRVVQQPVRGDQLGGSPSASAGKIASQRLAWGLVVRRITAPSVVP